MDIIKIAIESLGLNQVKEFDPNKNIIEYYLDKITNKNGKLIDLSSRNFSDEVSRETPAPRRESRRLKKVSLNDHLECPFYQDIVSSKYCK